MLENYMSEYGRKIMNARESLETVMGTIMEFLDVFGDMMEAFDDAIERDRDQLAVALERQRRARELVEDYKEVTTGLETTVQATVDKGSELDTEKALDASKAAAELVDVFEECIEKFDQMLLQMVVLDSVEELHAVNYKLEHSEFVSIDEWPEEADFEWSERYEAQIQRKLEKLTERITALT